MNGPITMAVDMLTSPAAGIARRAAALADAAMADAAMSDVEAQAAPSSIAVEDEALPPLLEPPHLDPQVGASVPMGGGYRPAAFLPASAQPGHRGITAAELVHVQRHWELEHQRRDQRRRQRELDDKLADVERRECLVEMWTPPPAYQTWGAGQWALVALAGATGVGIAWGFVAWLRQPPKAAA